MVSFWLLSFVQRIKLAKKLKKKKTKFQQKHLSKGEKDCRNKSLHYLV